MSWILGVQHGLGPARPPTSVMPGGATRPPNAALWADESGDITIENDLTVTGATVLVGGETFTGLVVVTSTTGAGAAGALGPEELQYETTQAATAGATIRNPGYVDWEARTWETTGGTSTTQLFGRFGAVIDTITAATGVPATYRLAWANTAGTLVTAFTEVGAVQAGAGTEALPGLCGIGDTNTGLRWNADDTLTAVTAGADRWRVGATGHLIAVDDALYDIGASGATRPANLFISGDATIGGLTANSMIYPGTGGILTDTVAATNGQVLVGSTGAAPALATLTATANQTTVTNGAASITVGAAQDIATGSSPTFANVTLGAGGALRTSTAAGNTLLLQARDVDGAAYTTFATLTANDTPTFDLADGVTKAGSYIYRAAGTDVALADGGLNASLVASNGGIFYSTATAGAVLAGTATANQALLSGSTAAPAWSTATYPATTTANQLLYSSGANTIAGLATAASGVLVTSAGSVPSIATDLPTAVTIGTAYVYRVGGTDVAVADGGTGLSSYSVGALVYASAATTLAGLADVAVGQVLASGGVGVAPAWSAIPTVNGLLVGTPSGLGATANNIIVEANDVDTWVTFFDTGNLGWSIGLDFTGGASGARSFSISRDSALGTNQALTFSATNNDAIFGGAVTVPGLLTATSSTGSGAAGALGGEEAVLQTTEAATVVATIRNPGYLDGEARTWETTTSTSTTQKFGRTGFVIDTITAATGVPATYRWVWTNTAGTIETSFTELGSPGFWGATPPTSRTTYTQTYATADATHATPTVGADIGAFTDPPSAAEMATLRTFVNALKADHVDLAQLVNRVIDDIQAYGLAL